MRRNLTLATITFFGFAVSHALAGEASTSATAGSGWGRNGGNAAATASYEGGVGPAFARTRTETGKINLARGVAIGLDEDGLDFSFSHAIAARLGPAYAGTFSLSIGRDGQVNSGYGGTLSTGGLARSATAGSSVRSDRFGGSSTAVANGNTLGGGHVQARTQTYSRPAVIAMRNAFRQWRR